MKKFRLLIIIFVLLGLVTACKPEKTPVNPESITINSQQSELEVNGSLQLTALVWPAEAEQSVVWSSSDESIATVDNTGKVLGLSAGTVSITATSTKLSSISNSISLKIKALVVLPETVTINSTQNKLDVDSSLQLTAVVLPAQAEQSVVWKSSDESIATVDSTGKVLGISPGKVSITATSTKSTSISNKITLKIKPVSIPTDLEDFDVFIENIFLDMIADDPVNVNFFLRYPENFELGERKVEAIDVSLEAHQTVIAEAKALKESLEYYISVDLTEEQELTYDVTMDYLNKTIAYENYYYYDTPLGSYLGYQAQLPFILAEYHFYSKEDLQDYFDYLLTTQETFENFIAFEVDRANQGFGLNDYLIDGIITQCDTFADAEENYLIAVFNDKVDTLAFLTASEKDEYKANNLNYINNHFVPAYEYLSTELAKLKGKATNNEGLAHFANGKEYYQLLFTEASGTNMTVGQAYNYFRSILDSEYAELMRIYQKNPNLFNIINSPTFLPARTYQQTYDHFLESYVNDFPSIGEVVVNIKPIHPSLEENSSPAMYFLSPIDASVPEVIYVNNTTFSENPTYAFFTIAHESIPGHLLQHVVLKNSDLCNLRKYLSFTSYAEAWAVYVEEFVGKYTKVDPDFIEAYNINKRLTYVILCVADIKINYFGDSITDFGNYLATYFGDLPLEDLEEMYYQLVEEPTNFFEYFFSYYRLMALKDNFMVQAADKNYENPDLEFHKFYLLTGPAPFYILEEQIPIYLNHN
ncbi:MAG TPA: DUF885 family protein [Bacilli bacterium]|nr:DUF885 family protein [Bacilli bacterium]